MRLLSFLMLLLIVSCNAPTTPSAKITIEPELAEGIKDGRLLLLFHHDEKTEPRFAVSDDVNSAQVMGMDFEDYQAGNPLSFDFGTFGIPAGTTFNQLVFRYNDSANGTGEVIYLDNIKQTN